MQDRFLYLLNRYYKRQASPEELEEFYALVDSHQYDDLIKEFMDGAYAQETVSPPTENTAGYYPPGADSRILHHVFQSENVQAQPVAEPRDFKLRSLWPRIAVAASVILAMSFGGYFLLHKQSTSQVAKNDPEQLAPVQNGVTLTLAKGQQIHLRKTHNGRIGNAGHTQISQIDSTLRYQGNSIANTEPEQHTLTNNSNTKFSVALADGSRVTLDIGSSLTYPVAFNSTTRVVNMTGQAYFQVKHVPGQRFLVKTKGQVTEDIGTEFNINAFDDETVIRTTLVEGSIKVNEKVLKPGEQAVTGGLSLKVETADIEEVTAWLQGKVTFEKEPLENILRKVARIYGVQIVYQDEEVKKYTYFGSVSGTKKLATVLNYFRRAGGVDFIVSGKTVKVFKQKKK